MSSTGKRKAVTGSRKGQQREDRLGTVVGKGGREMEREREDRRRKGLG
jgi:hypothetical protein